MPYGTIKIDTITFTDGGVDKSVPVSGLVQNPTFTGNVTVTGTISGNIIQGGTTVSGLTVTGTTANFASGVFTTQISGVTITGTTVSTTTGNFTSLTGTTATITSGIIASGTAALPSLAILSDPNTGIYSPGADQLAVATNGTQRITIDSSGRLLVGTATARTLLSQSMGIQIETTDYPACGLSIVNNQNANANPLLLIGKSRGTTLNSNTIVQSGDTLGEIHFLGADGSAMLRAASINCLVDGTPSVNDMPGRLVFCTTADGGVVPSERLRITSAGLVGIGTSSPSSIFHAAVSSALTTSGISTCVGITLQNTSNTVGNYTCIQNTDASGDQNAEIKFFNITQDTTLQGAIAFTTRSAVGEFAEKMRLSPEGRLGIGTQSPGSYDAGADDLVVANSGNSGVTLVSGTSSTGSIYFADGTVGNEAYRGRIEYNHSNDSLNFGSAGLSPRATIDSSGRLLIGTSTSVQVYQGATAFNSELQVAGSSASLTIARTVGSGNLFLTRNQTVNDGSPLGVISFNGGDGTNLIQAAQISAEVDGTPGANDMPGRLVFSTCPDSGSSPTERMRITQAGHTLINTTDVDGGINGTPTKPEFSFKTGSSEGFRFSSNGVIGYTNRAGDGTIIMFRKNGADEGSISVSGSTVAYNGAHLSRWSQLPGNVERTEILRGSVLSNLDEMCEWGEEENEQLNRMKVSTLEGDKNVSGVFQSWDDDDDTYTNDFYCAMTGDFIIRIAEGVTVERGDLLMSAGDGTAKPQDDDIIRSKTVAKVTSTNVSCTYEDGSYCVPCVLMAC